MAKYTPTPMQRSGVPLVEKGTKVHWDYATGRTEELKYEGIGPNLYASFLNYLNVAGYTPELDSLDYDPGRGKGTLLARIVSDGEPMYELFSNDQYKAVARHSYFSTLSDAEIVEVADAVERKIANPGFSSKQGQLWIMLVRGQEHYIVSVFVLRETKMLSKRSQVKASYTNVNKVDTPPNVSAVNTLMGVLPELEWLKKCPTLAMIGARRWKLTTEWWSDDSEGKGWSKILYNGTGAP